MDGITQSINTPQDIYEKYKDMFTTEKNNLITMDSFYQLLIAEMQNQDPLEPTSNTEFISQMATFTSLQAQQDNFDMQKQNYANSLVGQIVAVSEDGTNLKQGVVQYVTYGDEIRVNVDGKNYSLSQIKQLYGKADSGEVSQIGDYGAFAAGILGKDVTVQAADATGSTVFDKGTVSSIEIQDGTVRVIVNGYAYNVTDVVAVSEAEKSEETAETDSEPTENVSESAEDNTKTEETDNTENAGNQTEAPVEITEDDDIEDLTDEDDTDALYQLFGE